MAAITPTASPPEDQLMHQPICQDHSQAPSAGAGLILICMLQLDAAVNSPLRAQCTRSTAGKCCQAWSAASTTKLLTFLKEKDACLGRDAY